MKERSLQTPMPIFEGNALQDRLARDLRGEIQKLLRKPHLAIILVGDDPASRTYVVRKQTFGRLIGCPVDVIAFQSRIHAEDVAREIDWINKDPGIDGLIIQMPLPDHLNSNKGGRDILSLIASEKDVDGLTKNSPFTPATPRAIIAILQDAGIPVSGRRAVVIGRSDLVGRPTASLLRNAGALVTVCHSQTEDLPSVTRRADILVAAVGKKHLVTPDMVKEGSAVINVGITHEEGRAFGDIDPEVAKKAALFTPVVGGVGPITVAMLFQNLVMAAKRQEQ